MNKGLGATTFGAILLAGFLFQARPGNSPPSNQQTTTTSHSAAKPVSGEGPWLASCKYWSAAQSVEPQAKDTSPDVDVTLHLSGKDLDSQIKATPPAPEAACGDDGWGIPPVALTSDDSNDPEISAIVATIPDPIHSHLALDFDRSVDAILLAAADNGYLSSYYWLPWRSQARSLSTSESTSPSTPKDDDNTRERQPGLIVLRYAPDASEWANHKDQFSRASYNRVIYLFLVGETPALGVNGTQLQNAFKYEKYLRDHHDATLSIRPSPFASLPSPPPPPQGESNCQDQDARADRLSIIGPFFSGSAASLHKGIEAARRDLDQPPVSISGITGTSVAAHELDPQGENIYHSFGENAGFEQERFLQSLAATGYDLSRVAVLSEAGTVFGSAAKIASPPAKPEETSKAKQPTKAQPTKPAPPCVTPQTTDTPQQSTNPRSDTDLTKKGTILYLRFPRELSLLRNAQSSESGKSDASAPPTPYLNLSLKDYTADDTVPRFSTTQSPLSIEAQLMAIAHQLQRARSQFIFISASNILDDIFLVQFLHRACPDARLVIFSGGDLLFERDVDNAPYIGSITISPYLLTTLDFGNKVQWLHSDYQAEAIYNAASYIFWDRAVDPSPTLAGYRRYPVPNPHRGPDVPLPTTQFLQIPLWAAVIGVDGYYPLGILNWCGSNLQMILPTINVHDPAPPTITQCDEQETASPDEAASSPEQHVWDYVPESINRNSGISPSLLWMVLDAFILALCLLHIALLWGAQFWSPATRDLAVDQNDQPHRRSVYLNIGTSVLAAMAFVTAYPLILVGHYYHLAFPGHLFAWLTLIAAIIASLSTVLKTWSYRFHKRCPEYCFFNIVAVLALLFTITFWIAICRSDNLGGEHHTYAGLYFSYRCLQPLSGVCPLLPILLLLLAWYLWAMCQTARLRFSDVHRPRIARLTPSSTPYDSATTPYPLFVPDDALERCARPIDCCLYKNMTCLLITREVILRFCVNLKHDSRKAIAFLAAWVEPRINPVLATVYLFLFALCIFASHIRSLDRFLFTPILAPIYAVLGTSIETHYGPTLYEFLITALFFPLIMVALSGWFRTILIWGALSRGLLEPLERLPIRFAFTRIKGGSWVSMLNQSGLPIRWRDMSRSTEAIRQLVHHPYVKANPTLEAELSQHYQTINAQIRTLMASILSVGARVPDALAAAVRGPDTSQSPSQQPSAAPEVAASAPAVACLVDTWDRPKPPADDDLCSIYSIEDGYASFCTSLLNSVLVPHWDQVRTGLVEECNVPFKDEPSGEKAEEPEQAAKIAEAGETIKADETQQAKEIEQAEESKKPQEPTECKPAFLHLAEELIVVRYIALIRAVLVNMRYLMLFVSASFVLAIIAWNSYPFQPHRLVDWCFTLMLVFVGIGIVWVFAQMHRNPLLSRITDTAPNKLGIDFFIRIATFGAVPFLTWLAYQFPEIGGSLFRIFQPSLQVMK
jgi:hypothetical protein